MATIVPLLDPIVDMDRTDAIDSGGGQKSVEEMLKSVKACE